jgi:hypothetical protein
MADDDDLRSQPAEDDDDDTPELEDRDEELSEVKSVKKTLLSLYKDIEKGYENQYERANDQADYWDVYNCHLTGHQFYSGSSKIFVPIVFDAVNARKTRFTNQIFPVSGRNVEVTVEGGGEPPHAIMSLAEYYVRMSKLRTEVLPALMVCGDIEGHYNIYVSWEKIERHVAFKSARPAKVDQDMEDPDELVEDIIEETIKSGFPMVEVISDADVLVLPPNSDSVDAALEAGGCIVIQRRWTKAVIEKKIADEEIVESVAKHLLEDFNQTRRNQHHKDQSKQMTDAAGVKTEGVNKFALVYEVWVKLKIDGEKRLCRAFFGGEKQILGCKRNPYWSDRLPLLSVPRAKIHGSFKGKSAIQPVADLQYQANDAVNEAMDSAAYALMPIVMTDPLKNPRIGSMILSMAAIWETNPNDTKFAQFPALWKDGLEIVSSCKNQIFQSLSVNPAMITQGGQKPGGKQNQAAIAQEQQVDLLTTADSVTVIEEGILTPLIGRMIELDHQFRDEDLLVRQFGDMGIRAEIEAIPPIQMNTRYQFRWLGVETTRNMQQIQQQVAGINVLRGIPPELLGGYKLNLVPVATAWVESVFGPRIAPLVFQSPEQQMPVPLEQENRLLIYGFEVPTHMMDDDQAHIQSHGLLMQAAAVNENVEPGSIKKIQAHIWAHLQQAQRKQMQAQQQQMPQVPGTPGAPGGAGQGLPGQARPGAVPAPPRGGQAPPGRIHADQIAAPGMMPRKM